MDLIIFFVAAVILVEAYLHLVSQIWNTKSSAGISGKTHILYVLAYTTKCLAISLDYKDSYRSYIASLIHPYNTVNLTYLVLACIIVLSLFTCFRKTRERQYDTFRMEVLVICCIVTALLMSHEFEKLEILRTFSICLKAVAILPQFHMISKAHYVQTHVMRYLISLAVYNFVYLLHLVFDPTEQCKNKLAVASTIVQLILYFDFFTRVVPKLKSRIIDVRPEIVIIGSQTESTGECLKDNMSKIILTPASLLEASSDKANLLKDVEAK